MIDSSFNDLWITDPNSTNDLIYVSGVDNLSFERSSSYDNSFVLGGAYSALQVNSPTVVDLSFDRSFVQKDFLLNYTGSSPVRSFYLTNKNYTYKLKDLYLTNYSASFSVGDLPKISTKFSSYNGIAYPSIEGVDQDETIKDSVYEFFIPKLNSIWISGINNEYSIFNAYNSLTYNQKISSFTYSLDIKRQPYYSIGSKVATEVCPILPININFSITTKLMDEKNQFREGIRDFNNDNYSDAIFPENLNFNINISGASSNLISFPVRRAVQVSKQHSIQANNTMEIKRNFIGYYGI